MSRYLFQFALLLAVCALPLHADKNKADEGPFIPAVIASGLTVPPVAGVPFSATVVVEDQRPMEDGSVITMRTIAIIARDSKGRTHNERRSFMPESFHGSPPLMETRIYDPEAHIRFVCNPSARTARRQIISIQLEPEVQNSSFVHVEDLGATTLNGVRAIGTRRTYIISKHASPTHQPIEIVSEEWYSKDLNLVLLTHHLDPRTGEQTVGISGLKQEEPPASLFEIPKGYTIVDPNQPAPPRPAAASVPQAGAGKP
jgi:hypothetical protein